MFNAWPSLVIGDSYDHNDDNDRGDKRVRSKSTRILPFAPISFSPGGHQTL
jgi:hypothetical protein